MSDLQAINQLLLPHTEPIALHTIPLFGDFPDKKEQFGSGVLVKIAELHFIITAAHVADHLSDPNVGVYLPGPSDTSPEKAILCKAAKFKFRRFEGAPRPTRWAKIPPTNRTFTIRSSGIPGRSGDHPARLTNSVSWAIQVFSVLSSGTSGRFSRRS